MTDTPTHPLYVATRRLVKALDRLEGNLKQIAVQHDGGEDQQEKIIYFEHENHALKQEREKLNSSIAHLQRQYNEVHRVASTIYGKLDDSIKRLTQIIEE